MRSLLKNGLIWGLIMRISTEQRRNQILELLRENGRVRVSELSEKYGISEVSIRNDLETLEEEGHLQRVHGGAVIINKSYINMNLDERFTTNAVNKKKLAERVAECVDDNDIIMMNAGTTLIYVLRAIRDKKNITVVTNSMQNALEAMSYPSFNVILLGGQLDEKYQYTHGLDTLKQLDKYHAVKGIFSVDGINSATGLSLYYSNEVEVINKMMDLVDTVIVTADSTKLGKNTFTKVSSIHKVDIIVTNKSDNTDEIENLKAKGIKIIEA